MTSKLTSEWTTVGITSADRTDAWQSVLSSCYRDWQVPHRLPAAFYARVKQHEFAGSGLVETVCDPCSGRRTKEHIQRDGELFIGIQLTTRGRERFRIGDVGIESCPGDLVVWTTDNAVEFEVLERLHKITIMIPWSLLREQMPDRKKIPSGGKIESRTGIGSLLSVHLLALSNQIDALESNHLGPVSRSTLDFLSIALSDQQPTTSFDAGAAMLSRVHEYILQHLHEDDLNPAKIAAANRISLRYLHMLFHRNGATVSGWLQEKRITKCRESLTDTRYSQQKIAEIAYRWGFTSTSHFSRVFKARYGTSPGEVRRSSTIARAF